MGNRKRIAFQNLVDMKGHSADNHNGAPKTLALGVANPQTGLVETADYALRLPKHVAFIDWSIRFFGWPWGYIAPQQFVVQGSVDTQPEPTMENS